jgi:hypothetical protein
VGSWRGSSTAIDDHFDEVRERIHRTVQTNEVGRAAVLYAALLWLTERHSMPIRLLEAAHPGGEAVWLRIEPAGDRTRNMELTIVEARGEAPRLLATCGDHGAPVVWQRT